MSCFEGLPLYHVNYVFYKNTFRTLILTSRSASSAIETTDTAQISIKTRRKKRKTTSVAIQAQTAVQLGVHERSINRYRKDRDRQKREKREGKRENRSRRERIYCIYIYISRYISGNLMYISIEK